MGYQDAVAQAAEALKRGEDANWELARLTHENTLMMGYPIQAGRVSMEQWASDVRAQSGRRFSAPHAARFKAIWGRYGHADLTDRPSWTDAMIETVPAAAYEVAGGRRELARSLETIANAPAQERRDLVVKLMTDPIVADAVISQPEPRRAVYEALNRREQTAEQRRERMTDADPVSSELRGLNALLELSQIIERFVGDFSRVFQQAAQLPESDAFASRTFLTLQLERLQVGAGGLC